MDGWFEHEIDPTTHQTPKFVELQVDDEVVHSQYVVAIQLGVKKQHHKRDRLWSNFGWELLTKPQWRLVSLQSFLWGLGKWDDYHHFILFAVCRALSAPLSFLPPSLPLFSLSLRFIFYRLIFQIQHWTFSKHVLVIFCNKINAWRLSDDDKSRRRINDPLATIIK